MGRMAVTPEKFSDWMSETEPPRPANIPGGYVWSPSLDPGDPGGWVEPEAAARKRWVGKCSLIPKK